RGRLLKTQGRERLRGPIDAYSLQERANRDRAMIAEVRPWLAPILRGRNRRPRSNRQARRRRPAPARPHCRAASEMSRLTTIVSDATVKSAGTHGYPTPDTLSIVRPAPQDEDPGSHHREEDPFRKDDAREQLPVGAAEDEHGRPDGLQDDGAMRS